MFKIFKNKKLNFKKFTEKIIDLKLNLPKTEYNERLNIKENEISQIDKITVEFYRKQSQLDRMSFNLLDGPPFPTGKPHLGTLMNKVLKDIINRIKIMQGFKINFNLSFDCYGVEIEDIVQTLEKKIEIKNIEDLYESSMAGEVLDHKNIFLKNKMILKIRNNCRKFVINSIIEQLNYFKRLGIAFDPSNIITTFSKSYTIEQLDAFKQLYNRGSIYRDHRIVYWSSEDQRIVDYHELEERTELSDSIIVKFPIKKVNSDSKSLIDNYPNLKFLGYLSEPWKYIGIRALSINEDIYYCIVKIENEHLLCAYKRLPELAKRYNNSKPDILYSGLGKEFINLTLEDPVYNRELPVVIDNNVSPYFGTGINILSPAHDSISEKICRTYNLSQEGYIDEYNNFLPESLLPKVNIFLDGNTKVITKLKKHLFINWKYENKYYVLISTGERIPLRSIQSWFLKIDNKLKSNCLKELAITRFTNELKFEEDHEQNIEYKPSKRKNIVNNKEYNNIIEELDDLEEWCISEFNSWGSPIPYFIGRDNSILLNDEIIEYYKNLVIKEDTDIWWKLSTDELLPINYRGKGYRKGRENFDSWFDSSIIWYIQKYGLIDDDLKNALIENKLIKSIDQNKFIIEAKEYYKHLAQIGREIVNDELNEIQSVFPKEIVIEHINRKYFNPKFIPFDLVVEGNDQNYYWFLFSLLTSVSMNKQLCFRILKSHGFILDSGGKKLSKSLKNYIDPLDIIDGTIKQLENRQFGYGSDALRIYFCKNDSDRDYKLFEEDMEKVRTELKIIKKTAKLTLGYLNDYSEDDSIENKLKFDNMNIIEQILIHEYIKFLENSNNSIQKYNLSEYYKETYKFLSDILLRYYLDVTKYYFINFPDKSYTRKRFQYLLKEVFMGLFLTLTPIVPFTAENLYSHLNFYNNKKEYINFEVLPNLEKIKEKFGFTYNDSFDFNVDNLLYLRNALKNDIKYRKKNRSELELHLFNSEESYEYNLISSLNDYLIYFFGTSECILNSQANIKVSKISNKKIIDNKKILISFNYGLNQTNKFICERCYFYKCNKEGKVCSDCQNILNYL